MQNSELLQPHSPAVCRSKALQRDFAHSDKLWDALTWLRKLGQGEPRQLLEEKPGLESLSACPAWAQQPPGNAFAQQQFCTKLQQPGSNAAAAGDKVKGEFSSQPLM